MKANSIDSNKKYLNHSCRNPRNANKTIWSVIDKERKPATRQSHQEIAFICYRLLDVHITYVTVLLPGCKGSHCKNLQFSGGFSAWNT